MMYRQADYDRMVTKEDGQEAPYRPGFMRDYGRVIHSASFRRLQGKTQVFPGHESDFFRNRLTHSLEVAQIAEGIADRINHDWKLSQDAAIDSRLCMIAGLLHDIGHPPFGHNGERALDRAMAQYGGFEGNAQTLRIVARLEKKVTYEEPIAGDNRAGMNLSKRTLASILKYDNEIQVAEKGHKFQKGYYASERPIVDSIKKAVLGIDVIPGDLAFKTIECQIMDLADDFAYSVYDLEDSLKAGFLTPAGILASDDGLLEKVAKKVGEEINREVTILDVYDVFTNIFEDLGGDDSAEEPITRFARTYATSKKISEDSNRRTKLSSQLVHEFIAGVQFEYNSEMPALSRAWIEGELELKVEVLKQYTYLSTIYSPRVKLGEYRGFKLVEDIFQALMDKRGDLLMPDDVRKRYLAHGTNDDAGRARTVCDYVAGMTDRYAMEFWARLKSDAAESMFKPI